MAGAGVAAGVADALTRQAGALEVEYASMTGYKRLVDALLAKLDGSAADDGALAHGALPTGTLGTGFAEADALLRAYGAVHGELRGLSRGLAAQIEALGIAILTAGKGYGDVDEDTRRRMRAIVGQAKRDYVPDRDPRAREEAAQAARAERAEQAAAEGAGRAGASAAGGGL
ncbi:hypothetical protein AB0D46_24545 [Streptomyces sp. NPDC048383]|uniref:hypothetical protein n=1 Tax=Streptomyces sp. NPDC048383 TaxID=3155386 RepID=UPI00341854A9